MPANISISNDDLIYYMHIVTLSRKS